MRSTAIGILQPVAERVIASHVDLSPPAQPALDAELRDQRLRVVRWYSFGVGVGGVAWFVAFLTIVTGGQRPTGVQAAVLAHAAVLGFAGWLAYGWCRRGRLRHATYTNASALILAGTANLALIGNAEGAAVITYAVAVSLAALVIETPEWLLWGAILTVSALGAAWLHSYPPFDPVQLPRGLATASLLFAAPFGLAVPIGLFALFSRNLTDSREEAWELARSAAEANRLATERAAQLEQRTAQLQAKHTELNDFLYVVSHDLRAPLINLAGFSGTLQDSIAALSSAITPADPGRWSQLRQDIDESLDFIVRSVRQMEFLVHGLLELSRIDSRPAMLERVDLGPLAREVLDGLQYRITARGIAVRLDPLPVVTADRLRISQVFGNLLDNAVKYMKPEGDAAIHVGCEWRDGSPHVFVRDTGVGIRAEDQAKIFRLFSRVGDRAVSGDGIGLTAVKKIVEKLGGTIWVDSTLGSGSTFWFTLATRDAAGEREVVGGTPGTAATSDQDPAR